MEDAENRNPSPTPASEPTLDAGTATKPARAKMTRRPPKPRSKAWQHFTKFVSEIDGKHLARCIHCESEVAAHSKTNGTSGLNAHLRICPKLHENMGKGFSQTQLVLGGDGGDGSLGTWKFSQEACRKGLAEMIIMDELPFKFVEGKGFKRGICQPNFRIPSRWTVARDCYSIYNDEKSKLRQFLISSSNRVCLTTDTWTSLQKINYMCLTAHFIDNDWNLQKRIINFCPITSHKGDAIGKLLDKCLRDWGIDRVFTITVDNAGSNDTAIAYLKKKWIGLGTCVLGGEFLHMRCMAHILNLIVSDGLKEMDVSVIRVREAVKYVRQSPSRFEKFKKCAEQENVESKALLCLDVSTRWNSTYLMLETASKFAKVFDVFDDFDPFFKSEMILGEGKGMIEEKDWENVRRFTLFLQKFYDLTCKISGSSYVTCNLFLDDICEVYTSLKEWVADSDLSLNVMAKKMKLKFDKYWGNVEKMNLIMFIATFLDPRKKLGYVKWCLYEMYKEADAKTILQNLEKAINDMFIEYSGLLNPGKIGHSSGQSEMRGSGCGLEPNKIKVSFSKYKRFKKESGSEESKSELDKYKAEDDEDDDDDFDVLIWWKQNSLRYPILSAIARDIMAVPLSTIASESAFSAGGRVIDAYRSSLTPKLVQSLICAQDWLRGSSHFDDVEEDLDTLDKLDIDLTQIALEPTLD